MPAAGGIILGAGALWLLSQLRGGTPPPGGQLPPGGQTPDATGVNPNASGLNPDAKFAISVAAPLIPGAIGTVIGLVKGGIAAGGGGAATGGTVAASGTEVGTVVGGSVSAGSISGLVVEAIGGSLFVAGIILAVVADMVLGAYVGFQQAVTSFLLKGPRIDAARFFDQFMSQVKTKGAALGSQYVVHLPAETIRQALLTSMYLSYVAAKANNDALRNFYSWAGWDAQRMSNVCLPTQGLCVQVSQDFDGDFERSLEVSRTNTTLGGGGGAWTRGAEATVSGSLSYTQPGYAQIIAPPSGLSEMRGAAIDLLGAQLNKALAVAEFVGKVNALTWASVQGYGTFYPGDQVFSETLASVMVGWPVSFGPKPLANGTWLPAWWATDPATGNSFDIAGVRAFQMRVSFADGAPAALSGFRGFRGFSGYRGGARRLGRVGALGRVGSSQCVDPNTGAFIECPSTAVNFDKSTMDVERRFTPAPGSSAAGGAGSGGVGGLLLPALGLGAAALFFLGRKSR